MSAPDLTPTLREALAKALDADLDRTFLSTDETDALIALRDACPERPVLEDGIYEVPDEDGDYRLRYVCDGRCGFHRLSDGTLNGVGFPLPDDVSTWRRVDGPPIVTPEQVEAAARVVSGYPKEPWAEQSEVTKRHYFTRTRAILAAAGIEVGER